MWLDDTQQCGIFAQTIEAAEVIFRDKVKFAYFNRLDDMRALFPIKTDNASEIVFAHNNSSIRISTSMRSGTINRLHVSEMGSLPAVLQSGIAIIESTAEGKSGEF